MPPLKSSLAYDVRKCFVSSTEAVHGVRSDHDQSDWDGMLGPPTQGEFTCQLQLLQQQSQAL